MTSDRKTHNVEIYAFPSPTAISPERTRHHTVIGRTKERWLESILFTLTLPLWLPTDKDCDYLSIESNFQNSFSVEQQEKEEQFRARRD